MASMLNLTTTEPSFADVDMVKEYPCREIVAKQGDINTRKFIISLTVNGIPFEIPTGTKARFAIEKPYITAIWNDCDKVEKNKVFGTLSSACIDTHGVFPMHIELWKDGAKYTSANLSLRVLKSARIADEQVGKNEYSVLDNLIYRSDNAIKDVVNKTEDFSNVKQQVLTEVTKMQKLGQDLNSAESVRVQNENNRKSAETGRVEAEKARVNAENTRKQKETERINAENIRIQNENARKSAETNRASSESTRVQAENTRISQENARKSAESGRVNAEASRIQAEKNRVSAESQRATAESSRVQVEKTRVSAETKRQTDTATAIKNCDAATAAAKKAVADLDGALANVINDSSVSTRTTYSSDKINKLIQADFQVGTVEPTNQMLNGIWFIEENN